MSNKIIQLNTRSLKKQKDHLEHGLNFSIVDVAMLSQTGLKPDDSVIKIYFKYRK